MHNHFSPGFTGEKWLTPKLKLGTPWPVGKLHVCQEHLKKTKMDTKSTEEKKKKTSSKVEIFLNIFANISVSYIYTGV